MNPLLLLLSRLYGLGVGLRRLGFEKGVWPRRSLQRPVLSVGNLTVGGTGKTPLVALLARLLKEQSLQPVILSRGYRGRSGRGVLWVSQGEQILCSPAQCGDEPYWLAQKLPGIPVVVSKDRFQAGSLAEARFQNVVHLLDDGFQHLRLHRDLDLLVLDGTDLFGGGHLLPAGHLREPLEAMARADLIVVSRAHHVQDRASCRQAIRRYNPQAPLFFFRHLPTQLRDLASGATTALSRLQGRPVAVLAAIGNPGQFLQDVKQYGLVPVQHFFFRDHHLFTAGEIRRVLQVLEKGRAEAVVTTEKDGVRLLDFHFPSDSVFALGIEACPEEPEEFERVLQERLERSLAARQPASGA